MTHLRWMSLLIVAVLPMSVPGQGPKKQRDAHVIFKDGFVIKGKIEEQVRDTVFDSATGHAFPILSGDFYIDDHVRRIRFSPTNVDKVIQLKVGEVKEPMKIEHQDDFSDSRNSCDLASHEFFPMDRRRRPHRRLQVPQGEPGIDAEDRHLHAPLPFCSHGRL